MVSPSPVGARDKESPEPAGQTALVCGPGFGSQQANSSSRRSDALFWPVKALHARGLHTLRQNTHTHEIETHISFKKTSTYLFFWGGGTIHS